MLPIDKLAVNLGLSAQEIVQILPGAYLTTRAVHRRLAHLPDREVGRVGRLKIYPAWAIRRFIFGDLSAVPPGSESAEGLA